MAFIGKNTIENLTTAMYEDLRILYREYIQNSADSIDRAIQYSLITADEAIIEIEINKKKKYVCGQRKTVRLTVRVRRTALSKRYHY